MLSSPQFVTKLFILKTGCKYIGFHIILFKSINNFSWTTFTVLCNKGSLIFTSVLSAHRIFINSYTRQLKVRLGYFFIIRIHLNRDMFKPLFVSLINHLFQSNMFFKIWNLTSNNACYHIAHTITITYFFMLLPLSSFTTLCTPFISFISSIRTICK